MKKRLLSMLLTAVLLLSLIGGTVLSGAASELYGDTDGDGEVSILDATAIQRHLAELTKLDEQAIARGRVLGTDELSILDATAIQRYLAQLIDHFPAGRTLPTEAQTEAPTEAETVKPTEQPTDPPTEPPTEPATEPEEVTKVKDVITIYLSNNRNWTTVNAYVYNAATGVPMKAWPGNAMQYVKINNEGEQVYSLDVDVTKYDRVVFNNGTVQTTDTPISKASSGYFMIGKSYGKQLAAVYPYGQNGEGSIKTVSMDYPEGYKKKVYIWTPEGYDPADSSKKYSVLYMCDGQNLFGQTNTLSGYEWECDETVLSLMQNGGDGVIVVGVDNSTSKRDHELTPNLGKLSSYVTGQTSFQNGGGKAYADFVVDTVIPYVESHYNVNSIRGVAGSSSGGIEAFYIGMEHPELFRYVGALSPAFLLFDKPVWDSYLGAKNFSGSLPRVYFYSGNSQNDQLEQAIYPYSVAMEGWLKDLGYPADKLMTAYDNDAVHNEAFWALYFPEMLAFGLDV